MSHSGGKRSWCGRACVSSTRSGEENAAVRQAESRNDRSLPPDAPLCVDLDGTLLTTDTLAEGIILLIRQRPWYLLRVLLWLVRGRIYLKRQVAVCTRLDVAQLPFNEDFLRFLRQEHQ